jgi:DNA-binding NtrC family response regulator
MSRVNLERDHPAFGDSADTAREGTGAHRTVLLERHARDVLVVDDLALVIQTGPRAGEQHALGRRLTLGTAPDVDVVLEDPSVSRRHVEIVPTDAGPLLLDLGSKNGSFLGAQRVERAYLARGASLRLGRTELAVISARRELELGDEVTLPNLEGTSAPMRRLRALIARLAPLSSTVLIEGESGTGKEQVARALHAGGPRAAGPLVFLDCGTLAPTLVEAELFGHERGAFTGAEHARAGAFQRAHGGTIVLDEIGELPLELQPKLLRVLETRAVRRLGGERSLDVDVRIVAATHADLERLVRDGRFRMDLFHRLAVVRLEVPPLRERIGDVALLARAFAARPDVAEGRSLRLTDAALARLEAHAWRGNVRELENVIRAAAVLCTSDTIDLADLPRHLAPYRGLEHVARDTADLPFKQARATMLSAFEADYLARVLTATRGNVSEAARRTGIHRKTIERLVRRLGLDLAIARAR